MDKEGEFALNHIYILLKIGQTPSGLNNNSPVRMAGLL